MAPDAISALIDLQEMEFPGAGKGNRDDLTNKATHLRNLIPLDVLDLYDTLKFRYRNRTIVRMENGACSGCHIMVPASQMIEVDNNLYICEHCGRLICKGELAGMKLIG